MDNVANIVNDEELADDGQKGEDKKEDAKKQARILLATLKPKGGAKVYFLNYFIYFYLFTPYFA